MKHSPTEYKTILIPPDEQSKLIAEAMKDARRITKLAIDKHWQAFLSQIRDKVGVENIAMDEPYLKFEIVKNTLEYLKKLENTEYRFTILPQVERGDFVMSLNAVENRHVINVNQSMDEHRQQEFGVKKYVWRTAMDDRVRPSHAANEGKVFEWKDGDGPGTEENCRCSAEPFPEYSGADDPPIIPVYPLETLLAIYVGLTSPIARQIGRELLDVFTDDKPSAPAPETQKPEAPLEKPSLNDTKTWSKPPKDGKYNEGVPSRTKPMDRGEKSLYDEKGGEWRYAPEDKYHNEHWDYKPPGKGEAWENVPIDNKPPVK